MYGNYPTGYSYIAISISGRPDMDGRAVWEGGKDTAADKKPSLLVCGVLYMLIEKVDSLATGTFALPVPLIIYMHTPSQSGGWKWERTHTHAHSDKTVIRQENKIKKGNTRFEKCTLEKLHFCICLWPSTQTLYAEFLITNILIQTNGCIQNINV